MHLSRQQPRWHSNRWITAMQAATNTMLCSSVSLNNPKKNPRRRSCDSMPHFAAKCHAVFWALARRSAPTLMTWAAQSKNKTKHESVTQALGRAIYWQGWALQYCKEKLKGGCTGSTEWLESHMIKSESGVLPVRWVQTKVEVSCYYCYYETSDTSSYSRDSLKTWMFILFSKWIQRHLSYGVLSFSETVYLDFLRCAGTKADFQTASDLISAEGQLTEIVQQCGKCLSFPSSCELH